MLFVHARLLLVVFLGFVSTSAMSIDRPDGCNTTAKRDEFSKLIGDVISVKSTYSDGGGAYESFIERMSPQGKVIETINSRGHVNSYSWQKELLVEEHATRKDEKQPYKVTTYSYDDKGQIYRILGKSVETGEITRGEYILRESNAQGAKETCLDFSDGKAYSEQIKFVEFDQLGRPNAWNMENLEHSISVRGEAEIYGHLTAVSSKSLYSSGKFKIKYEEEKGFMKVTTMYPYSGGPLNFIWYDKNGWKVLSSDIDPIDGKEKNVIFWRYSLDDRGNWIVREEIQKKFQGFDKSEKYTWEVTQRIDREIKYKR